MRPIESKPIPQAPDALVVGAGMAGLLSAALLVKSGKSVHLAEMLPKPGGRLSPEKRGEFVLGSGFAFGDGGWWRAVADRLGLSIEMNPVSEGGALVNGSRGWVTPEEIPAWEAYLSQPCSEFPVGGVFGIVGTLLQYCASHSNFSYSSETPATALHVEDALVKNVSLGAETLISPGEVHWCAPYKTLSEVIQGPNVPEPGPERVSWMKKFVKTQPQPGVVLEFGHKTKLAEFTESLLLPFSAGDKEERRYMVGSIVSNRDPSLAPAGQSLSTWILPLTEAEWGDNHESMKKIRAARRLLDKTFPGFDKNLEFDRVLVLESTCQPLGKKKGERHSLLKNLHLGADWAMPHGATFESLTETLLG